MSHILLEGFFMPSILCTVSETQLVIFLTIGLMVRLRKSRHANVCSENQFFRETVVVIAFSEFRPGSNERYENSTFYGPFRFLILILVFNK